MKKVPRKVPKWVLYHTVPAFQDLNFLDPESLAKACGLHKTAYLISRPTNRIIKLAACAKVQHLMLTRESIFLMAISQVENASWVCIETVRIPEIKV